MAKQANVYRANGEWAYALWIDGEYDHSDPLDHLDADATEEEALGATRELVGSDARVTRVADVNL